MVSNPAQPVPLDLMFETNKLDATMSICWNNLDRWLCLIVADTAHNPDFPGKAAEGFVNTSNSSLATLNSYHCLNLDANFLLFSLFFFSSSFSWQATVLLQGHLQQKPVGQLMKKKGIRNCKQRPLRCLLGVKGALSPLFLTWEHCLPRIRASLGLLR